MINETFISMCREAKEIQAVWVPKIGDKCFDIDDLNGLGIELVDEGDVFCNSQKDYWEGYIWVPRIEDLQEIHYNNYLGQHVSTTEKSFHRWFWQEYNNKEKSCLENYDWNELWLCFVMNKCFNKQWNGETWVEL